MPALKAEEPGQEETVQDGGDVVYEKEHDDGVSCAVFIECVCVHGRCSADHAVSHSPSDLSELLKVGTVEAHDKAENTQFVKDFLKGHIRKELFKIFNELERVGKTIKDEVLDGGLPEYDGKGDLSKCPYYAAKTVHHTTPPVTHQPTASHNTARHTSTDSIAQHRPSHINRQHRTTPPVSEQAYA
ncbi:UNVERIFIED_CONTAM: hypothetical protein FKN15_048745 [Acipenser sinensis]